MDVDKLWAAAGGPAPANSAIIKIENTFAIIKVVLFAKGRSPAGKLLNLCLGSV
jgi:hypothetical protein